MNVAFEDPFIVIGSTHYNTTNPYLRIMVSPLIPVLNGADWDGQIPPDCIPLHHEEYAIDLARLDKKGWPPKEGLLIKVKKLQDIKPLKIKPYCELDWRK